MTRDYGKSKNEIKPQLEKQVRNCENYWKITKKKTEFFLLDVEIIIFFHILNLTNYILDGPIEKCLPPKLRKNISFWFLTSINQIEIMIYKNIKELGEIWSIMVFGVADHESKDTVGFERKFLIMWIIAHFHNFYTRFLRLKINRDVITKFKQWICLRSRIQNTTDNI